MTREEKDILIKELCFRLLYKVRMDVPLNIADPVLQDVQPDSENVIVSGIRMPVESAKPVLRSIDSMSEEEQIALGKIIGTAAYKMIKGDLEPLRELLDYVGKNNIDLFGLISRGLAIETESKSESV